MGSIWLSDRNALLGLCLTTLYGPLFSYFLAEAYSASVIIQMDRRQMDTISAWMPGMPVENSVVKLDTGDRIFLMFLNRDQ